MWSSGTGFAGVFGYAWVALLHMLGGWGRAGRLHRAIGVNRLAWLVLLHMLGEGEGAALRIDA